MLRGDLVSQLFGFHHVRLENSLSQLNSLSFLANELAAFLQPLMLLGISLVQILKMTVTAITLSCRVLLPAITKSRGIHSSRVHVATWTD